MLIVQDLKTREKTWISNTPGAFKARPGVVVMKFGEQLRSSVIREYQWYYIDYDDLKSDLKNATGPPKENKPNQNEWSEDDEARFVGKLESSLRRFTPSSKSRPWKYPAASRSASVRFEMW